MLQTRVIPPEQFTSHPTCDAFFRPTLIVLGEDHKVDSFRLMQCLPEHFEPFKIFPAFLSLSSCAFMHFNEAENVHILGVFATHCFPRMCSSS